LSKSHQALAEFEAITLWLDLAHWPVVTLS
jgi:hypothetical protein